MTEFMKTLCVAIVLIISTLPACTNGSLTNPKRLVPPVTLTRAEYYLDGGSLGGTLSDSRGQHLDFFFNLGFDSLSDRILHDGEIYMGFISGHRNVMMRARFIGWRADDLYALIERTIRDQFLWDAKTKKLRPKNPRTELVPEIFGWVAATGILRHVERKLQREVSYLR